MKNKILLLSLVIITVVAIVIAAVVSVSNNSLAPEESQASATDEFVYVEGKDIKYKGQVIYLRGTNVANISALLGTNIGGIGSGKIEDVEATEADYTRIKQEGANHVRFGLSYNWYKNNETKFFQVLDQHVAWAKSHNLWMVMNLFTLPGDCYEGYSESCSVFWDSSAKKTELKNFWVKMAQHFVNEPTVVGFDLINEPVGTAASGWADGWFALAPEYISAIRAVNTKTLLFIEAGSDAAFTKTFTGGNIIYEVHFYDPIDFTHNYSGNSVTYPGTFKNWEGKNVTWNKANMLLNTGNASVPELYSVNWANSNNVPIYFGEWGALSSGTGYVQYISDVADVFNTLKVHSAHYSWKAGNTWGLFPLGTPNTPREQAKLDAVKKSWMNNIFPGGTTIPTNCTSFTYSNWSACTNGTQIRTVASSLPNGCTGGTPVLSQSCTVTPPVCTSFTYSNWSTCTNGSQSRTVATSSPAGCTGGSSVLTQSCTVQPAYDGCKADYNKDKIVNLADLANFAKNYKIQLTECTLDITGNNCFLDISDFQKLAEVYKKSGLCQ